MPKPFHNLRASRETELVAEHPLHVVCTWLGHLALVAQKHYLQVTDADFERAAQGGVNSGAREAQFRAQQPAAQSRMTLQETAQVPLPVRGCDTMRNDARCCEIMGYAWQDSNLQPLVP